MMTLGELLRVSRTEKEISLDALEDAIKVNKRVLESLEQDRIDPEMPPVYVRGFISSYCRYVGIDEHEALDLYEGKQEVDTGEENSESRRGESEGTPRRSVPLIVLVLVAVGLLLYVGFITLSKDKGEIITPPPPAEEALPAPPVSDKPVSPPVQPALEPNPDAVPAAAPPAHEEVSPVELTPEPRPIAAEPVAEEEPVADIDMPEVSAPSGVRVRLDTTAEAWIQATVDDGAPDDKIYRPGNSVTWEATDTIALRLGNVGGVKLVVNGIPMKPFGKPNQVMRLTFTDTTVSINRGQPQDLELWRAKE